MYKKELFFKVYLDRKKILLQILESLHFYLYLSWPYLLRHPLYKNTFKKITVLIFTFPYYVSFTPTINTLNI